MVLDQTKESWIPVPIKQPLKHSERIKKNMESFVYLDEVYIITPDQVEVVPYTYQDDMTSVDATNWIEAMKSKINSIKSNNFLAIVDPPKEIKPIGCKWVYERKKGVDGKVKTYKARLVVKDFN